MFNFIETEVSRTYKFRFDEPVFAIHPNHKDQELSFTEASITLSAVWDAQAQRWKAKRNEDGSSPTIALDAPQARRVRNGKATKLHAFHSGGKISSVPIPLTYIQKRGWHDELQETLRTAVVSAFWSELLAR